MEIIKTPYVCSPSAFSGAFGHEGGVRVLAPTVATAQGTGLPIAMRDRTDARTAAAQAAGTATALLPISATDVVGDAGIRSWSPPV